MEFDIVEENKPELLRTAGSAGCDTVLDSSATIVGGEVEPGGSLRIKLRDESHRVGFL